MADSERLVVNLHDPELTTPLAEFREQVQEMFAGRDNASCGDHFDDIFNMHKLHAESPVGSTWQAPFVLHGAHVSALIIDNDTVLTEPRADIVSVLASYENIVGPGRNEGESRHRRFTLTYSRQDQLGNIALWRVHKQTFKSEHANALGETTAKSEQKVAELLATPDQIGQYLRGAAHMISVFLDPEKHPKTQLLK